MKLRIKRLSPHVPLPSYARAGDAGLDLVAADDVRVFAGDVVRIATGIAVEIPEGYEGQVRGRSSLSARGIFVPTGTIDSGYRGEVGVVVHNASTWTTRIEAGQRIAQLVIAPVARCEVEEVEALTETERGAGGFGSTGRLFRQRRTTMATKKTTTKKTAKREYVIVRTTGAGVHCGELVSRKGDEVTLANTRRIWHWDTREDAVKARTLSDVSRIGAGSKGRVSAPVTKNVIIGAHEVITCSPEGERALREIAPWA